MLSLLCVEDEPLTLQLLLQALSMKFPDMELLSAQDGREGLELFRLRNPDIVLTDINMPLMDGIQMAAQIRALAPLAEIVVLTGHGDMKYLLDAMKLGVGRYLVKPIRHRDLFATIEDCINKRAAAPAPPAVTACPEGNPCTK